MVKKCVYTNSCVSLVLFQNACDLCINLAEDQMDRILVSMEENMLDPVNGNGGRFKQVR